MRTGLKIAIVTSGRSQRDVAAEIGMAESKLSSVIGGWCQPQPAERDALKRVLGVDDAAFENAGADMRGRR